MKNKRFVVLGPPGCGKTSYLLDVVDAELAAGTAPDRIGYFSFTRKAASEAADRAVTKFKLSRKTFKYFRTLHSLAFQELGMTKEQVLKARDYRTIGEALGLVFSEYMEFEEGLPMTAKNGDQCVYLTAMSRATLQTLEKVHATIPNETDWFRLKQFNDTLEMYKKSTHMLDYPDMLDRYLTDCGPLDIDVAIIDEAQDLSRQQWRMVEYAVRRAKKIYIAGDDDQSIYRWSGADVEAFMTLKGDRSILAQSYRVPEEIHKVCDRIAGRIHARIKKVWAPKAGAKGEVSILGSIEHIDWREGSYLLLARNRYLLSGYEELAKRHGLPYTIGNRTSVDQKKVQAIFTWERLRKGQSQRGTAVREMYSYMTLNKGVKRGHKGGKGLPDVELTMGELREHYGLLMPPETPWMEALSEIPPEEIAYYVSIKRKGGKLAAIPRVHISTIHGVKGGEADHVVVLSDMAARTFEDMRRNGADDEHRTAYVAASRAKSTLEIVQPQGYKAYNYL